MTLVKELDFNNGATALKSDFTLIATGPSGFSGVGPSVSSDDEVDEFQVGTYTLSESGPDGYTGGDWICTGDGVQDGNSITLDAGESATCTITNTDDEPSLTLVKELDFNSGGIATESDFTLFAEGPSSFNGPGPSVSSDDKIVDFQVGTYTLSEDGPSGYTGNLWVCEGDGVQDGSSITLGPGDSATCTIVNSDDAPGLTLVKELDFNNGATALKSDFTLFADGPSSFNGTGPLVSSGADFIAGTYSLSETGPDGYTGGDWICTGDGVQDGNSITLGVGESATCTITNTDDEPSLTLVKELDFNNGATALKSDFTLIATGPSGFSGVGPSVSSDDEVDEFQVGTYTLSESGPDGYTGGDWICTGDGVQDGNSITLDAGESATCTITNTDDEPSLTLVKELDFNSGGIATESDFTLFAEGPSSFNGPGPSVSSDDKIVDFQVGTYTLSEDGPSGYTGNLWVCEGDGVQDGSSITLGPGDSATCTIVNSDDAPGLTLVKELDFNNGATALKSDFTLFADGPSSFKRHRTSCIKRR